MIPDEQIPIDQITAVILAGGMGKRMGGVDKGQFMFNGQPMIEHILSIIRPQVGAILINANRNRDKYAKYGHPVIEDSLPGYKGPLAGFLSGLQHAKSRYLLVVPCDGPFLPADLVSRLATALLNRESDIAVAYDGHRLQPVYALLKTSLLPSLQAFLDAGDRKIDLWYAKHKMALADFSDIPQTFRNINTPEDHARLQDADITT